MSCFNESELYHIRTLFFQMSEKKLSNSGGRGGIFRNFIKNTCFYVHAAIKHVFKGFTMTTMCVLQSLEVIVYHEVE